MKTENNENTLEVDELATLVFVDAAPQIAEDLKYIVFPNDELRALWRARIAALA